MSMGQQCHLDPGVAADARELNKMDERAQRLTMERRVSRWLEDQHLCPDLASFKRFTYVCLGRWPTGKEIDMWIRTTPLPEPSL